MGSTIGTKPLDPQKMREQLIAMAHAGNAVAAEHLDFIVKGQKIDGKLVTKTIGGVTGQFYESSKITEMTETDLFNIYANAKRSFKNKSFGAHIWGGIKSFSKSLLNMVTARNEDGTLNVWGTVGKLAIGAAMVGAFIAAPVVLPAMIGAGAAAAVIGVAQVGLAVYSGIQVISGVNKLVNAEDETAYEGVSDIALGGLGAVGGFSAVKGLSALTKNAKAFDRANKMLAQIGEVSKDANAVGRFAARMKGAWRLGIKQTYGEYKILAQGGKFKELTGLRGKFKAHKMTAEYKNNLELKMAKALKEGNHAKAMEYMEQLNKATAYSKRIEENLRLVQKLEEIGIDKILSRNLCDNIRPTVLRNNYRVNVGGKTYFMKRAGLETEILGVRHGKDSLILDVQLSGKARTTWLEGILDGFKPAKVKTTIEIATKDIASKGLTGAGDDLNVLFGKTRVSQWAFPIRPVKGFIETFKFTIGKPVTRLFKGQNPVAHLGESSSWKNLVFSWFKKPFTKTQINANPTATVGKASINFIDDASNGINLGVKAIGRSEASTIAQALAKHRGIQASEVIAIRTSAKSLDGGVTLSEFIVTTKGSNASGPVGNYFKVTIQGGQTYVTEISNFGKYKNALNNAKNFEKMAFRFDRNVYSVKTKKPLLEVMDTTKLAKNYRDLLANRDSIIQKALGGTKGKTAAPGTGNFWERTGEWFSAPFKTGGYFRRGPITQQITSPFVMQQQMQAGGSISEAMSKGSGEQVNAEEEIEKYRQMLQQSQPVSNQPQPPSIQDQLSRLYSSGSMGVGLSA